MREKITVKVEWTGKRLKPIDIPNGVAIEYMNSEGDVVRLDENTEFVPSKTLCLQIKDGNFKVYKLDGCRLIVVDEGNEVVFE